MTEQEIIGRMAVTQDRINELYNELSNGKLSARVYSRTLEFIQMRLAHMVQLQYNLKQIRSAV